jgi:hypothetical protein
MVATRHEARGKAREPDGGNAGTPDCLGCLCPK